MPATAAAGGRWSSTASRTASPSRSRMSWLPRSRGRWPMPDALDVPVSGGSLRVATWPGTGDPVLAIHGITSSSRSWPFLPEALDNPVLAPDLRGRGRSNELPGPVGMAQHAEDCAAVVDASGGAPLVVVGHSMGGFVASVLAATRPDLVRALVLVDVR